jgi:phasin family protein
MQRPFPAAQKRRWHPHPGWTILAATQTNDAQYPERGEATGERFLISKEIAMNLPQAEFLDLYKAGLKGAVDVMKASLESAERLQQQQLSAIRGALELHVNSVNDLSNAKSIDELLALQQKMASSQFERAMGYWGKLCQAAGQNQTAAIGQVQSQMAQARDWFNETYTLTARATEEAARIAAVQQASSPGMRQQQQQQQASKGQERRPS